MNVWDLWDGQYRDCELFFPSRYLADPTLHWLLDKYLDFVIKRKEQLRYHLVLFLRSMTCPLSSSR